MRPFISRPDRPRPARHGTVRRGAPVRLAAHDRLAERHGYAVAAREFPTACLESPHIASLRWHAPSHSASVRRTAAQQRSTRLRQPYQPHASSRLTARAEIEVKQWASWAFKAALGASDRQPTSRLHRAHPGQPRASRRARRSARATRWAARGSAETGFGRACASIPSDESMPSTRHPRSAASTLMRPARSTHRERSRRPQARSRRDTRACHRVRRMRKRCRNRQYRSSWGPCPLRFGHAFGPFCPHLRARTVGAKSIEQASRRHTLSLSPL